MNEFLCPICNKKTKLFYNHLNSMHDAQHSDYKTSFYKKLDGLICNSFLYTKEIFNELKINYPFLTHNFVAERAVKIYPGRGPKIFSERRKGDNNVSRRVEVKNQISNSVAKRWEEGNYKDRINGMLGKSKELAPQYKLENHSLKYLAMHEYSTFLSAFQQINKCEICGRSRENWDLNIHHIDENPRNFLPSNMEVLCVFHHMENHYKARKNPYASIVKTMYFESAHHLPNYDGACGSWHGHSYKIEVEIRKRINRDSGMVIDFALVKNAIQNCIISKFDHAIINDYISNPTAENMVIWCWERLMFDSLIKGIEEIKLWETRDSYASIDKKGMLSIFSDKIERYSDNDDWFKDFKFENEKS